MKIPSIKNTQHCLFGMHLKYINYVLIPNNISEEIVTERKILSVNKS